MPAAEVGPVQKELGHAPVASRAEKPWTRIAEIAACADDKNLLLRKF
jgi:hypothetical protein